MKKIRIKFCDFWDGFQEKNNFIYNALIKEYFVEISDSPDYLFYSCFGNEYLKYDCIRIFYTGENVRPDFNLCDYAIGFDFIQFEDRYLRFPQFMIDEYQKDIELIKDKRMCCETEKEKFCNFLYSNAQTKCQRVLFFKKLSEYKRVDSGGKALNNINYIVGDKLKWQQKYKFSIAFENSSTNGYVTEKIVQAFSAGTIPIYWGNPKVELDFNTEAFINCHDYDNFDEVVQRVIELDGNRKEYLKMLSQPVFTKQAKDTYLSEGYLENFLYHIVEQDKVAAKRVVHEYLWTQKAEEIVNDSIKYCNIVKQFDKKSYVLQKIMNLIMGRDWKEGKR